MSQLQPVRGTRDLLPAECQKFRHIIDTSLNIAKRYGFEEIETPILESSSVFSRTLGDTSDIVTKQMYTFNDRGGDEVTLRPEGTAGVARAFISEGLNQLLPLKLFYSGPMFRYERPQKGRFRQFYQFGVELLGVDKPLADLEVIALGAQILEELGLLKSTQLLLNTIGDKESRATYHNALVSYLKTRINELSDDSKIRLEKNPLRILDSKDEGDRKVLIEAPRLNDFLNSASQEFFSQIGNGLSKLGIPFVVDPLLVRGLDYYCHTVFEFTTTELGSQNAVLSGGRYDGLINSMGGPITPAVGWASGIDRLAMMITPPPTTTMSVAVIPGNTEFELNAIELLQHLRKQGICAEMSYSGNMTKRLQKAAKNGDRFAVILGEREMQNSKYLVKDLQSGLQEEIAQQDLVKKILS